MIVMTLSHPSAITHATFLMRFIASFALYPKTSAYGAFKSAGARLTAM
jgi:hypothetical protein